MGLVAALGGWALAAELAVAAVLAALGAGCAFGGPGACAASVPAAVSLGSIANATVGDDGDDEDDLRSLRAFGWSLFVVALAVLLPGIVAGAANLRGARVTMFLYAQRFLSSWGDRMWQMAVPILFIDMFRDTLLPVSVYVMIVYLAVAQLLPALGVWLDHAPRLRVQQISLGMENFSVAISSLIICIVTVSAPQVVDEDGVKHSLDIRETIVWFTALVLLGCLGEVFNNTLVISLDKDWVVVIAQQQRIPVGTINSWMRRIDLVSKALSPAVFTGLYQLYADDPSQRVFFGAATVGIWNMLSFPLELILIRKVYSLVPALAIKKHTHLDGTRHSHEDFREPHFHLRKKLDPVAANQDPASLRLVPGITIPASAVLDAQLPKIDIDACQLGSKADLLKSLAAPHREPLQASDPLPETLDHSHEHLLTDAGDPASGYAPPTPVAQGLVLEMGDLADHRGSVSSTLPTSDDDNGSQRPSMASSTELESAATGHEGIRRSSSSRGSRTSSAREVTLDLRSNADDWLNKFELVGTKAATTSGCNVLNFLTGFVTGFRVFMSQTVFLASLSYTMLYMTVLDNGALMTSFVEWANVPPIIYGVGRGVGAVMGLVGTFLFPCAVRFARNSLPHVGLYSLWAFFVALLPIGFVMLAFDSNVLHLLEITMIVCVSLSRTFLWIFDLAITEMVQASIPEEIRGVFNSAQTATFQLFFILVHVAGIVFADPSDFRFLVMGSLAVVGSSAVTFSVWFAGKRAAFERAVADELAAQQDQDQDAQ